jgi:hypothetical protein
MRGVIKGALISLLAGIALFFIFYFLLGQSVENSSQLNSRSSPVALPNTSSIPTITRALNAWQQGQYQESVDVLKAMEQPFGEAGFYQFYFNLFLDKTMEQAFAKQASFAETCQQQLLFVTGEANSLVQAEKFRQQLNQDQRLKSLPICSHELIWFNPKTVKCAPNTVKNNRITCDLSLLAKKIKTLEFTHLVVFSEK